MPVEVLMKSAPAAIASNEARRTLSYVPSSPVSRITFRWVVAAGLLHPHDLVVDLRVAAGEERAAVDHHVDFVGTVLDHPAHLLELRLERRLARRERGRDGRDLDAAAAQAFDRRWDEVRIDAERGDRGDAGVGWVGPDRLRGERRNLAGRVGAFERRQVGHPDGQLEREHFRLALDRALRKRGRALLERNLVDRADPGQPRLERELEAGGQSGCLRHGRSLGREREQPLGGGREPALVDVDRVDTGGAGALRVAVRVAELDGGVRGPTTGAGAR